MAARTLLFLCLPSLNMAFDIPRLNFLSRRASRNVPTDGYYSPVTHGGSMLTSVPGTFPAGLGEPINVILSGHSDDDILQDRESDGGLRNFFLSLGFSGECLGQHEGSHQAANLGDGNGYLNETAVIRWNYGDPALGSCKETIQGGNHFRYWIQNGGKGNSGAIFMAASYEKPISLGHDIIINGYNLGRDWLIGNMTGSAIPTSELTNTTTYSGATSSGGYTYHSDINYVSGILSNSSEGINHFATVGVNGTNAIDGLVAIITAKITVRPQSTSDAHRIYSPSILYIPVLMSIWSALI